MPLDAGNKIEAKDGDEKANKNQRVKDIRFYMYRSFSDPSRIEKPNGN